MFRLGFYPAQTPPNREPFAFGTNLDPAGRQWSADGVGLRSDGRYVLPVMGEVHYSRLRKSAWRDALLRMKAGGITVVASYVFWIHHEEVAGEFNFTGDRDLAAFVRLCGEVGLPCVIRCGPWCHGEVRNGGLPEWVIDRHAKRLRTDDPAYLADVAKWYAAIAGQLRGLLWKDGGPVVGIQIENEYGGDPQHLLSLKRLAVDAGLDVPFYTRTGWPELTAPMPFGELLPLFGGYAEGFWDRELETMPWRYRHEFVFKTIRTDAAIASEHFGDRAAQDAPDTELYPYLTCEIGAGMMSSYHRRITVFPQDALALAIVKLGSGSNGLGWYMFHGGTNPDSLTAGGRFPLNEHQATRYTNYNDLPTKSYDFQTAIGEFGQVREQYHLLRPLHLFLADFGERLVPMATVLPTEHDESALRYGVRSDGQSGFVFVNNYERLQWLAAQEGVQFEFSLRDGPLTFPETPTTVAPVGSFFWPFNFDLGGGVTLVHATAQPVCQLDDGDTRYVVFARTNNPAEFVFATPAGRQTIADARPGREPLVAFVDTDGRQICVLLLDESDALRLWKGEAFGQTRLVLSDGNVIFDGDGLRLTTDGREETVSLSLLPPPTRLTAKGIDCVAAPDGVFGRFDVPVPPAPAASVSIRQTRHAGPPRRIPIGVAGVAAAPTDADFASAAEWQITLPDSIDLEQTLLRVHYEGDVARTSIDGRLVTDHFFNGTPFDIGLAGQFGTAGERVVTIHILPLQKRAPIYMLETTVPSFGEAETVGRCLGAQLVRVREIPITAS